MNSRKVPWNRRKGWKRGKKEGDREERKLRGAREDLPKQGNAMQ